MRRGRHPQLTERRRGWVRSTGPTPRTFVDEGHSAVVPSAALLVALPAALLVALLVVTGCADSAAPPVAGPGTPTSASPAATTHTSRSASPFNGTDIAWLQLTVAMHERVLPMLDLVPERTADPAVRRLAVQVRDTHRADLDRARKLMARTAAPPDNPHQGHDMPGMLTSAELKALGTATDPEFRRLFGQHLRDHLEQSIRIARAEQTSGADPATTALAAAIVRTATTYLHQLS